MKKVSILALVLCLMMFSNVALAYTLSAENVFPVADELVELDIWTTRMPSVDNFETQYMTGYMEELTGVHINWTQVDLSEKDTKLNLSLASGNYPDVYATGFSTSQILQYADDVFIPLNDLIEEHAYNIKKVFDVAPDAKDYITAPNGNIYTLFRTDVGVHMLSKQKMFVNTEWLEAYGSVPNTTEEFREMLAFFRDNDMNGNGDAADEMPLVSSYKAWGGDPINYLLNPFLLMPNDSDFVAAADKQVYFVANTEEFREGLRYAHSLYEDKLLAEETYVQDETQMAALINKGDKSELVAGAFSAAWEGVYVDQTIVKYDDYTPIAPLEGPTGLRQAPLMSESGVAEFVLQCAITTACEDPALAIKFLDYGANFENFKENVVISGFEGMNYNWNDTDPSISGELPSREPIVLPAVQTISWNNHTMPGWDTQAHRYLETAVPGGAGVALYDAHVVYEPYYKFTGIPLVTWSDDADLAAEQAELHTLITDYVKASYTQFILGVKDLDADWDVYVNELNAMGLERYLEIRQIMAFGE